MGKAVEKENATMIIADAINDQAQVLKEIGVRAYPPREKVNPDLAAYALNLCLVSISQIIDYNDLVVLDQEYDTILNNLDLEHMPKDEPLLNILRQILDTVSFFRMHEGDKKFVELEYQHEMKNAIWSAVPNVNMILGSGSWVGVALSIVTQVGSGYMNYRKTKARSSLERDKKMWELQKAAMEQFHGLRRELFTTAWRLVDEYKIKESLRLTEKQITEYNNALKCDNLYKKFLMLEMMQEKYFKAYPQIYYQLAHTALVIYKQLQDKKSVLDDDSIINEYKEAAGKYYKMYFDFFEKNHNLLREDSIYASAAVEYAQLFEDASEKKSWLDKAVEMSNTYYDILQMCAMAYVEIGEIKTACELLKKLILVDYNVQVNVEMLGFLYIRMYYSSDESDKYRTEFDNINNYASGIMEIEFPQSSEMDSLNSYFLYRKRKFLAVLYKEFAESYYNKKFDEYIGLESEEHLVEFIDTMVKELEIISAKTGLRFGSVRQIFKKNFEDYINLQNKKLPNLEMIFCELYENAFKNCDLENKTLEEISKIEGYMTNFIANCNVVDKNDARKARYLKEYFDVGNKAEGRFGSIKKIITSFEEQINSIKPDKYEMVVHGSIKYDEYIKEHYMKPDDVVAILDGKSGRSNLIFTTNGVNITMSEWHKGMEKAGALFFLSPFVGYGVSKAHFDYVQKKVAYSDVEFKNGKVKKPEFTCDENVVPVLVKVIEEIKKVTSADFLTWINKIIDEKEEKLFDDDIKQSQIISKAKAIIEKYNDINYVRLFSKDYYDNEQRKKLIEISQDYINDRDINKYKKKLEDMKSDELHYEIRRSIDDVLGCIGK